MGHLRLLFWLKWKLMLWTYRRSASAVVGAVLALCIFFPITLGFALGCGWAFHALAPRVNGRLLPRLRLLICGFWVVPPLLRYALTNSSDSTPLFIYPLSVREIFSGAILGALIDFPILLPLPTFAAVLFGFSPSPGAFL